MKDSDIRGNAFADPRGAAAPGDDGTSLGDRNAPTATYAMFSPAFHMDEKLGCAAAFPALFGGNVLDDPATAYSAVTQAIGAFERTDTFAPFDNKYDRWLRGEVELTREEDLGRTLFFSQKFTNCADCHKLSENAMDPQETFSDYLYHNFGVPKNEGLRARNGVGPYFIDLGLGGPDALNRDNAQGTFRTPTLRNVAITAPYMHNGAFEDLRTVILFYDAYDTRSKARKINPETGKPFGPPAVPDTVAQDMLEVSPALEDNPIYALVAFLETLTDTRYEHLLED